MAQSDNYSPDYSFDDNRSHALALHDLDLTGSPVRALASVMEEARDDAPADHAARLATLHPQSDGVDGLSALLATAFPRLATEPTTPRPKLLSKMTKRERADHDAHLAVRRATLEELKADSARLLAEKKARKAKGKPPAE